MRKIIRIFLVTFILLSLFALAASAVSFEPEFLRAGGGSGSLGGGGGIARGFFRITGLDDWFDNTVEGRMLSYFVIIPLYILMFLTSVLTPIILFKRIKKAKNKARQDMAEFDDFDGFWSYEFIQNRVKEVYFALQKAWSENDIKSVENMLSDKLYEQYRKHLKGMKNDHEKNVLKDIELIKTEPVWAKNFTNDGFDYFWSYVEGSMIDYTINLDNEEILQGSKKDKVRFIEYWKFVKGRDGVWVLDEIKQKDEYEKEKYYKGLVT